MPLEVAPMTTTTGKLCEICGVNPPRKQRRKCNTCRDRITRQNNPIRAIWRDLRHSARRRKLSFTIPFEWFREFAIESALLERRGNSGDDFTVDRIRVSEGYAPDNIRVLTNRENAAARWGKEPNEGQPF